jgi:O-antigen/teichoic acid export membrane protein
LVPDAFGLAALVAMLTSVATVLTQLGVGSSIVHAERLEEGDAAALYGLSLVVGLGLMAALALLAPVLAFVWNQPTLAPLVAVQSLTLLFSAPTGIAFGLLQRRLRFSDVTKLQVLGACLYGATALCLAAWGAGVWALVLGRVLGDALLLVPALRRAGMSLRPNFDRRRIRRFLGFGGAVTGAQLLILAGSHLDTALVGGVVGPRGLGLYSLAFMIAMLPATRLASVVKRVAFAALSRDGRAGTGFETNACSLLLHLSAICLPLVAGIAYTSHDSVALFLGVGWGESARIVVLLAPAAAVSVLGSGMGAILLARGRPEVELHFAVMRLVGLGLGIGLGVHFFGVRGAAAAVSTYHLAALPLFFFVLHRWGGIRPSSVTRAISPGVVGSVLMALPVLLVDAMLSAAPPPSRLAVTSLVGAAFHAAFLRLVFPAAWRELRRSAEALRPRLGDPPAGVAAEARP